MYYAGKFLWNVPNRRPREPDSWGFWARCLRTERRALCWLLGRQHYAVMQYDVLLRTRQRRSRSAEMFVKDLWRHSVLSWFSILGWKRAVELTALIRGNLISCAGACFGPGCLRVSPAGSSSDTATKHLKRLRLGEERGMHKPFFWSRTTTSVHFDCWVLSRTKASGRPCGPSAVCFGELGLARIAPWIVQIHVPLQ